MKLNSKEIFACLHLRAFKKYHLPGFLLLPTGLKFFAFITMTVSFSDDFKYASEINKAGPEISESTSREKVTEGRFGTIGSTAGFSTLKQVNVKRLITK